MKLEHKTESSGGWTVLRTIGFTGIIVGALGVVTGGIFLGIDLANQSVAGTNNINACQSVTCVNAVNAANADSFVAPMVGPKLAGASFGVSF